MASTAVNGNRKTVVCNKSSSISSVLADRICNPTLVKTASPPVCKAVPKGVESVFEKVRVLDGDFLQVISVTSKVKEGVVITEKDGSVSAKGRIVPHGKADPTDVKTAYVHVHRYGPLINGSQRFLLLPMMRSSSAPDSGFVCPMNAGNTVSVLSANGPLSTVEVKELNVNDKKTEENRNWLWFSGSASGTLCRLYIMPDGVRKFYMAADSEGSVFLTEDEPVPNEGEENPETYMRIYRKYHDGNES